MYEFIIGMGIFSLPWWGYILLVLGLTHVTIACVTIFLHRGQAHGALVFHPVASHFMRAWLWLTTGMVTREWVAIHRKHHNKVETEDDPHSPRHQGLLTVLFKGAELYRQEAENKETLKVYGAGTPADWLEKNIYSPHSAVGIYTSLVINYALFGFIGVAIWAVQMMWIPFFAAGVVNGAAHALGYRNFDTPDDSTNLGNIGLLIGGEELHNNHHAYPGSAKMSIKPWEFDIGWLYIRVLEVVRLVEVKRLAPVPSKTLSPSSLNMGTVADLFHSRLHVMAEYVDAVMRPTFYTEFKKAKFINQHHFFKSVKKTFLFHESCADLIAHKQLQNILVNNHAMQTSYEFKCRLQSLWKKHRNDHEKLKESLLDWCVQAEESGLQVLQDFAVRIKGYTLKPS